MKLSPEQLQVVNTEPSLREIYALHLASIGMKIIPLKPGLKVPADFGWQEQATSDSAVIKNWFETRPKMNYGIACGQSGLLVVDLDVKKGDNGIANWRELSTNLNVNTFEVETPSGGLHLYFWGEGFRNSAGTIARGVDLRASGGYVVGPGSQTAEGTYSSGLPWHFPDTRDIQTTSEALKTLLGSRNAAESPKSGGVHTAPRVPVSKHLAEHASQTLGNAIWELVSAGEGSRNDTLNRSAFVIGALIGQGYIEERAARNLLESTARQIGLEIQEIRPTIDSGIRDGQLKVDKPGSVFDALAPFDTAHWFSSDHPEPKRFGSGNVLTETCLTWLVGEPASGKSLLCMVWAIEVMLEGGRVLWIDEEAGPRDTLGKFVALGANERLIRDHLIYLEPNARNFSNLANAFIQAVEGWNPDLIIVDSAAAVLANSNVQEDSNSEVSTFIAAVLLPLAKKYQKTTVVIDHKTKNGGVTKYARGAGAKLALADMSLHLSVKQSFSKVKSGQVQMEVAKDRNGNLTAGWVKVIDVLVSDDRLELKFSDDWVEPNSTVRVSPTEMKLRLLDFVANNPGTSKSSLERVPGVKNETKRAYIADLVASGKLRAELVAGKQGYFLGIGSQDV
ncbi:bifunctional DNA primase/polymerase [Rhodoluna limnophila]|uniref:bifunctional DNA primase/polymerase n=1 Tax=Rhodoluna limnophila TaxID=232537 RepID=UPI001106B738|nr:bifunctional DNA primase/polymerase [Rhodoluna limnophila]